MIEFRDVQVGYGSTPVLSKVSFSVARGELVALIGPNGCGKTTLLKAAARQLPVQVGTVRLCGRPVAEYGRREFARTAAFMPQVREVPAITVRALVSHGRFPYLGLSRQLRVPDREAIEQAMCATGVADWAEREVRALSGGERQRVYVAMALAQGTDVILLDEPTTYLDLGRQFELLELLGQLNAAGKTIVVVLHDLAQALQYSHRVALFDAGTLVACTTPDELFDSGRIEQVFGVQAFRAHGTYCFAPLR